MEGEEEIPQYSKEVARGSFWSLLGNIAFKLVSFLYVILIARAASQDDIGLFYLALSVVSIISIFSDIGLAGSLTRYIPYFEGRNEKGKIRDLLNISYIVSSIAAVVLMALLWWQADAIGEAYHNPLLAEAIRMLVSYLFLVNLLRLGTSALQGFADIRSMQYVNNMQNGFKLILTAAFFYLYGASVLTLSAAFIISHIPAVIMAIISTGRKTASFPSGGGTSISTHQLFGEIVPFGIMLNIVTLFWSMTAYADRLLLGYFIDPSLSTETVAVYSIAITMATVLMLFPGSVANIFLPVMSRLAGKNEPVHMRAILETSQRWSLLITLPMGLVMIIFASDMLGIFYGQAYAGGALTMAILTFGFLIQALSYVLLFALAALRLVKLELKLAFIVTMVNVILNALLIPIYGMEGSAMASVASCVVMTILLVHYGNKLFSFSFPAEIYKLVLAAIITFAIVFFMKPYASAVIPLLPMDVGSLQPYINKIIYLVYLGILGAISTAIFIVFAIILKCFRNEDVLLMKKALHRAKMPPQLISVATAIASFGVGVRK
ncbi:MAG: flippase [Candidatus ainarchaeum sp.]|nr:flippase [Candidatus ainarchaeum sp.]